MPAADLILLASAVLRVGGEPERILEIECGEGDGVLFLAREYPRARVRGTSSSEQAVRRAGARIGLDPEGRVAFKLGRPGSLPFPDDHFDLVAQREGMPRVSEIARVLRRGGDLVLAPASPPGDPLGLRRAWGRHQLSRHGFEPVAEEDGFLVTRLRP